MTEPPEFTAGQGADYIEQPKSPRGICDRCKRPGFLGRLLYMGNNQWACIDCFQFLTGSDDRDPVVDPSAVSGIENRPVEGERPIAAPLPSSAPWWARLLHWLGVEIVNQR